MQGPRLHSGRGGRCSSSLAEQQVLNPPYVEKFMTLCLASVYELWLVVTGGCVHSCLQSLVQLLPE